MTNCNKPSEAHIQSFRLETNEALKIIQSGRPLDAEKLQDMGATEIFGTNRDDADSGSDIAVPESIGSLVFPNWFAAPQFFCFCSSVTWCLLPDENGLLRYYLKCNYWCIPAFSVVA